MLVVVTQIPFVLTIWYSFQKWVLINPVPARFGGFSNYDAIVADPMFRAALLNTAYLTVGAVIVSVVIGLVFAVLLNSAFPGRSVVRTLVIAPFLIMMSATSLLWKSMILDPTFGLVDWALKLFGVHPIAWLTRFALPSVIATVSWHYAPFAMLIILAGLQSLPPDIIEAAQVDGAGWASRFAHVVFPFLRQYIELAVLFGSMFILASFSAIAIMTQGGPGNDTMTIPYYVYEIAFEGFNIGQAAAAGVIVVGIVIIIASVLLRVVASIFRSQERW
ncbi:MAG: carbohydrate ABC transporter permease [Acidimicrobiales bacterium]